MKTVLECIFLTLRALLSKKLWNIFFLSAMINVMVCAGLAATVWKFVQGHTAIQIEWIKNLVESASMGLAAFVAFMLFPLTFPLVITFFEESISTQIERAEYGIVSTHSAQNARERLVEGMRFFVVALLLNLALIPFYFIPVFNVLLYYTVNGYLLGREFFEMVASRHLVPKDLQKMRRRNWLKLILAGLVIVFGSLLPGLNLAMPMLSVVFMVHLYYKLRQNGTGYGTGY